MDYLIVVGALLCVAASVFYIEKGMWQQIYITVFVGIALLGFIDVMWQGRHAAKPVKRASVKKPFGDISQVILLDEFERPIKSWSLSGKTSLMIGRENKYENVDIDLEECEYSALIDFQHAVLNYCMEQWYIEDLYSKNGIRIRKTEDSVCYRIAKDKPCRLSRGDVILVANTKLLFT